MPSSDSVVSLREITSDNFKEILRLKVTPRQESFVASNDRSIAEAHFDRQAWYRGIYADEHPVGFLMLADENLDPAYDEPECCSLWRLMIDARYQRLGFGRKALELVVDHVRAHPNATMLLASYLPGDGSPEQFYHEFGFTPTGEMDGNEIVISYDLEGD